MVKNFSQSRHDVFAGRIKEFIIKVIQLTKSLPKTEENVIFIKQIIRSATSIGANYAEAMYAHSQQDFIHTMNICRRETSETKFWLEMFLSFNQNQKVGINTLLDENIQLLKIFITSVKTANQILIDSHRSRVTDY